MIQNNRKLLHTAVISSFAMVTAACSSLNSEATQASAQSELVSAPTPTTLAMPVATLGQNNTQALLEGSAVATALEQINQYNQQKQYQQSLALTQQLRQQYPENPDLALMEGVLFNQLEQIDKAEQVFLRLSEKHPELPEPLNNLAVIYVNRGDLNRAISTLQQAFETHPSYARVQSNLRTLYTTLASQAYNRALNLGSQAPAPVLTSLDRIPEPARTAGHQSHALLADNGQPARIIRASSQTSAPLTPEETAEVQADIIRAVQSAPAQVAATTAKSATTQSSATEASRAVAATSVAATPVATASVTTASADTGTSSTAAPTATPATTATATPDIDTVSSQPEPATPVVTTTVTTTVATTAPTATAEASAATVAPNQPDVNPREELKQQVRDWAAAWSAQDVPAYLSFYTADFRPANRISNKRWKKQRQQRLTRPKSISVDISGISIRMKGDKTANVSFTQRYRADSYRDKVIKTLTFQKLETSWKISAEVSRKVR